jgi:competence protein ComEA
MPKKTGELHISPALWIAYGLLCGLLIAGLIVWLNGPQLGEPISLLPQPAASATGAVVAQASAIPAPTQGPLWVNINTATIQELQQLPNIGPVIAQGIVNYRDSHGPFTALEQIQNVSGIGAKTFAGIQPFITLGDEP